MSAFAKFHSFVEALAEGVHNLSGDALKMALTNTAPTAATDTGFLPGTLHPPPAAANGYAPAAVNVTSSEQVAGTYTLAADDVVFTAVGGDIGPARYAILYNDTAPNDEVIGYWDRGASVTVNDGETITVDLTTDVVLTLA
ncbi:MAG TPA: hypothetical protein VMY35_02805 [Phycisphaerae bacterium]|nr:hypothetical protein [Phycisphaerae bacterium]